MDRAWVDTVQRRRDQFRDVLDHCFYTLDWTRHGLKKISGLIWHETQRRTAISSTTIECNIFGQHWLHQIQSQPGSKHPSLIASNFHNFFLAVTRLTAARRNSISLAVPARGASGLTRPCRPTSGRAASSPHDETAGRRGRMCALHQDPSRARPCHQALAVRHGRPRPRACSPSSAVATRSREKEEQTQTH
jgi:hypothetical protein